MINKPRTLLPALRAERKLTQEQLANKVGIKQATLSQIETGARNMTDRVKYLIIKKLKLPIDYFDSSYGTILRKKVQNKVNALNNSDLKKILHQIEFLEYRNKLTKK